MRGSFAALAGFNRLTGGNRMKKAINLSLGILLVMTLMLTGARAQGDEIEPTLVNTTQKGSLLIFPWIEVHWNNANKLDKDTIVKINNDGIQPVRLHCFWVTETNAPTAFFLELERDQPAWFFASGHDSGQNVSLPSFSGERGELVCFAVSTKGGVQRPIACNQLFGSATVFDYDLSFASAYDSWNFKANAASGLPVGTPGELRLTGAPGDYDACPETLVMDFVAKGGKMGSYYNTGTKLYAVSCKQDLRQDSEPSTKTNLRFVVENENGVKFTGASQCMIFWFGGFLHEIAPPAEKHFTSSHIGTDTGGLTIKGIASTACTSPDLPAACCEAGLLVNPDSLVAVQVAVQAVQICSNYKYHWECCRSEWIYQV
jgi:hypothetical protein